MDNAWEGWKSLDFVKPEHALVFDFSGTHTLMPENPTPGSGGHGTGMAQAFHEMAPEAEVYLIYDLSGFSWSTASSHAMIGYFGSESISLVSASNNMVNTNLGVSLSGSDPLSLFLDECINSSITVCVIAGNYANNTSSFRLEKESGTNNMLFPNGTRDLNIEVSGASPFNIIITRSGFQRLHANYTYQLTNQRTNISVFKLNASPFVSFNSPSDFLANVGDTLTLNIMRLSDTVDYLDIIIGDFGIGKFRLQNPGEMNKASSIALPGASKKAITTGAVLISNYNVKDEISSMSGWGPIPQDVDESGTIVVPYTIKPELCAPSEGGATSPTAPRVAGALAVLTSAGKIDLTKPEEVKRILTTKHVIQMGGSVNNMFGHGRLYLDADTDGPPPTPPNPPVPVDPEDKNILICPNPVSLSVDSYVKIANFSQDVSKLEARIYNINGEFVRSFSILELQEELNRKTLRWDLRNENGSKVAPGVYFISIKTDSGKNQIRKIAIQK